MNADKKLRYVVDLVFELTKKEIKVRYKNSFLGYIWSILSPLSLATVFFVAFKIVIRINIENYVLFLISGLFAWQWFSNSLTASVVNFLNNVSLIKKVKFPKEVLIYSTVLNDMFHFLLSVPVIIIFLFIYKKMPNVNWLIGMPLLLLLQFFLISGFCLTVASINLFFRDLERLIIVFLNLLFYCTPVIYSETMVPEKYKIYLYLNPVAPLIISYRNLFLLGDINWNHIILLLCWSVVIYSIGYAIYKKLEWRFAEVL